MRRFGPWWLVLLLVGTPCWMLSGCGSSDEPVTPPPAAISGQIVAASPSSAPPLRNRYAALPAERGLVVEIDTSCGNITIRLDPDAAPVTVRNFLNYINGGLYDGTVFHYVKPGVMILGGGFSADLEPKAAGVPIRNEAHNGLKNKRGTVAMSRALGEIDSATCQFYINLADNEALDFRARTPEEYGYCVFGEVVRGMDVADAIGREPTHDAGAFTNTPVKPAVIRSIREVPAAP